MVAKRRQCRQLVVTNGNTQCARFRDYWEDQSASQDVMMNGMIRVSRCATAATLSDHASVWMNGALQHFAEITFDQPDEASALIFATFQSCVQECVRNARDPMQRAKCNRFQSILISKRPMVSRSLEKNCLFLSTHAMAHLQSCRFQRQNRSSNCLCVTVANVVLQRCWFLNSSAQLRGRGKQRRGARRYSSEHSK